MMRHFLTTEGWSRTALQEMVDAARALRAEPVQPLRDGMTIALGFFNPSLRTRTSFEVGAFQLGAHAVVLEPGKGAWPLAFEPGVVMDGDAEEHVAEAARVLSRYCDLLAVRCFPKFQDWSVDREDGVIAAFAQHATVPVVNMETIVHPCQELAHVMTLQDRLGDLAGRRYLLTWTYHPRPLNTAVANSAAMIATKFGMRVTMLCPDDRFLLDARFMEAATVNAAASGGSFEVSHDIDEAYDGAEIVYAKSWGSLAHYGDPEAERPLRNANRHFIVDAAKMSRTDGAVFSHCLPCRRNVKVTDEVIDAPTSLVIEEAENRLHVQKALMVGLAQSTAATATAGEGTRT